MRIFRKIYCAAPLLALSSIVSSATTTAGTLCEFNLMSARTEGAFAKTFRENINDREFKLKTVNPNANSDAIQRMGIGVPDLNHLTLKIVQLFGEFDPGSAVTLKFKSSLGRKNILGPRLQPASYWAETDMEYEELARQIEREGGSLANSERAQDLVSKHIVKGSVRQGLIIEEFADGSRSYFSFGQESGTLALILGLDVPCAKLNVYTHKESQPTPTLRTDKNTYCRVPILDFQLADPTPPQAPPKAAPPPKAA